MFLKFIDLYSLPRLDKCLNNDMMPQYGSDECCFLFEQGPCEENEWFVLDSALNNTVLPYYCEKALDCELFTLETQDVSSTEYLSKLILKIWLKDISTWDLSNPSFKPTAFQPKTFQP